MMMLKDENLSKCLPPAQTLLMALGAEIQVLTQHLPGFRSDPKSMWLKGSSCFSCPNLPSSSSSLTPT